MTGLLPPLAAVRAFEAAARLLNFTEAAQALGMSQAAVSYQIKTLEERLGVPLFHRTGRRVELTSQGQALAPVIIRAFDEMRTGFANLRADTASVLTISCTQSFAHLWLAPRIGQFQMLQPDLAVRIHTSDQLVDFARDQIDVAIRGGGGSWPGSDAELLIRNRVAPLCSPDFLARHSPIETAADLLALPRLSPNDAWWEAWFKAMGIATEAGEGPPALALDSQVLEGRAAMAGQGFAILTPWFWRREIEAGLLVEPVPSNVTEIMNYWVAYPHANRNLPRIKQFRDWIRGEFARERDD
ncbi:LysR substrate-binding domain-containing protein [Sphingobium nicotianae]|uniref:LysR family transcriptional regulator n=1 Tax=Sphingobium nicotianae TaxID=2782607 RepID=A0A9X1ISC7_9SPHN|nr:LysR substrate-binding domain-containing protein [Sphingobium nicotianae]MBT2188189.1 LysR family transcriptional regulator [Sphingobium nicotianae]